MSKTPILEVKDLTIKFGGLTAVDNFNLTIYPNQIIGLIGPNGSGKTTIFNLLTKVYSPTKGDILIKGKSIKHLDTVKVNIAGIGRTFQNIRLFQNMSVIDNVILGLNKDLTYNIFDSIFKTAKYAKQEKDVYAKAVELLKIFHLEQDKDNLAKNLPYGKQRRLEILRALATKPALLLLDEPAAGMNPSETMELMNTIKKISKDFHCSTLLIEHDMKFVMGICEQVIVLNHGVVLANGTPAEVINNKDVISAYLGGE